MNADSPSAATTSPGRRAASIDRRLLSSMAPVRSDLALGFVLAAGTLVAGVALAAVAAYLISTAALVTMFVDVAVLVTAVRAFAIGRAALRYGERYVTHRATLRLLARLRATTFAALEPRSPAAFGAIADGDVLTRLGADIDTIDGFYLRGLVPPVAALAAGIVVVVGLALVDPMLGAIAALGFIVGGVIVPPLVQASGRDAGRRQVAARADLQVAVADEIAGNAELVAFGVESGFTGSRARATSRLDAVEGRLALVRGASEASVGLIAGLAALAVVAAAIPLVRSGRVEGVVLAALPLAVLAGFEGVAHLPAALERRAAARAAAARVFELVDAPIAVVDPLAPSPLPVGRSVTLENVTFRYAPSLAPVLTGVSLSIADGCRLAIEAPSGAGKSTIASLIVRFWTPESGRIEIGGVDVTTCRADDIRALIGVVPQHPYLFNGTIRDNLLVARGDASDEEILAALDGAGLGRFVASLPIGLGTIVGSDGLRLSGGQRQQIAIARILLKDAPIVILDEATAHLDEGTETEIVAMLDGVAPRADHPHPGAPLAPPRPRGDADPPVGCPHRRGRRRHAGCRVPRAGCRVQQMHVRDRIGQPPGRRSSDRARGARFARHRTRWGFNRACRAAHLPARSRPGVCWCTSCTCRDANAIRRGQPGTSPGPITSRRRSHGPRAARASRSRSSPGHPAPPGTDRH